MLQGQSEAIMKKFEELLRKKDDGEFLNQAGSFIGEIRKGLKNHSLTAQSIDKNEPWLKTAEFAQAEGYWEFASILRYGVWIQ